VSYILSLDQGTSSSKAIIFDENFVQIAVQQEEFQQIYPEHGWVEHNPADLILSMMNCIDRVLEQAKLSFRDITSIGITNQRETIVAWDSNTGKSLCNAIVWQDRRTTERCKELMKYKDIIHEKTGLFPDPYFSATKMEWMLKNCYEVERAADKGTLRFGTVDSWLIWNLTKEKVFVTDYSNASRTMLFNINEKKWDKDLLELFGIDELFLPDVVDSSKLIASSIYGPVISGIAGDQQASLFGQTAFNMGDSKCTYGTGSFLLMNTGDKPYFSENRLLTTIGWKIDKEIVYALEGSIFNTGALITWLKDGLNLINDASETEKLAREAGDNGGVYFSGALTGLGAPYWDPSARGLFVGMTRGTKKKHLVRAVLESIAYSTKDLIDLFVEDTKIDLKKLLVDGGVTKNNFLMDFQANLLGVSVDRSLIKETTALGAAMLAGLAVGVWTKKDLEGRRLSEIEFKPNGKDLTESFEKWKKATKRSLDWKM